jgi:GT2 family glycosyltransferase
MFLFCTGGNRGGDTLQLVTSAKVTVIIPVYKYYDHLQTTVDSVLTQDFDGDIEVIVGASADDASQLPTLRPDPRVKIRTHIPALSGAAARNMAAEEASGGYLAFTDADVVTLPGWVTELVAASSNGTYCVAGAIVNGTPDSASGTVEYLTEFLDLHPERPPRTAWHGALCNLLIPRTVWERHGPFPENWRGGEDTYFTVQMRLRGLYVFTGAARVVHMNRTEMGRALPHQYNLGKYAALLGRHSPYKMRPLVRYTPLAPIAVVGRVVSLYARVAGWMPRELIRTIALFPLIVLNLIAWGAGLIAGGLELDREALATRRGRSSS